MKKNFFLNSNSSKVKLSKLNHLAIAPAVLALGLLMPASSSAQLYTTTSDSGAWNSARWSTSSDGPFNSAWVSGSDTSFLTGNYTFDSMFSTTGTIGNITTGTNVTIGFTNSSSQQFGFGGAIKTFDLGAGSVVDFGGIALLGTGGNGLIKNGAGTLTLSGGNYQAGLTINAGNMVARTNNGFGTGALNINGGAIGSTANYTSSTVRINGINIGGDFQIGISGSVGSASSTANMTFNGAGSTVNLSGATRKITLGSSGSMTFGGVISNGGLTLTRNSDGSIGSFSLTGINTFASGLTIDGVAVNASSNNEALGAGAVTLGGNSGFVSTLNLKSALTIANDMTIANTAGIKTITNSVANATINGTITNNDSTGGVVIGATTGRTFNIGGINGNGTTGVTFGGGTLVGTVVMNGAGTYTGNTVIDGSILRMSGAGSSVSAANLVFNQTGGSAVTPTFDLNGTQQTVAGLDDSAFAGIIRTTLSGGKLIVGDSNNSTFRGTIISGNSLELEKVGSGKLTLTGANTYTNGTTISGGELEVSSQSLRGDVINDARLTFNQAVGAGTFSGNISGTGSFFKGVTP